VILYLDASALVKRYVAETGSGEINQIISQADIVGTAIISRAEVAAAFAKSIRVGLLSSQDASAALQVFRNEWLNLVRIQLTEMIIGRADNLAWQYQLRGYDSVHLAAASLWQEALGLPLTIATFDRQLWTAARGEGLVPFPSDLTPFRMK
jgi:predicted nucleic acid-binding protein